MAGKKVTGAGKGKPPKKISLYAAASQGDLALVKQALAEGADVNVLKDGMSPLLASSAGSMPNLDVVRALLEAGADPNLGEVALPLRQAASRANTELVRILLEGGADPNARTSDGRTALMSAVGWDNGELVQLLLDAGADPDLEDTRGMTALSEAISRRDREAEKVLRARDAEPDGGEAMEERPVEGELVVAAEHKRRVTAYLTELARAAGAADPVALGRHLSLLAEGAIVQAHVAGDLHAARHAKKAAELLIAASTPA